jgi:hypothetical protein
MYFRLIPGGYHRLIINLELIDLSKFRKRKDNMGISKTAIVLIIFILAVPGTFFYIMYTSVNWETKPGVSFPAVEITILDDGSEDEIQIKHVKGGPLDWSEFRIHIRNKTDESDSVNMKDLGSLGILNQGEISIFNSSFEDFKGIDFQKGCAYYIQISHKEQGFVIVKRDHHFCE